jgi:hypothetical protein
MGQTNQWGLQNSYQRARAAVITANLMSMIPGYQKGQQVAQAQMNEAVAAADNGVLSQSFLRLDQPLLMTNNILSFTVLQNASNVNNPQLPTEVRLRPQDSFFSSSITVYLSLRASSTDTSFRPETYPNVNIFTLGAAGNETVSPLNNFYNGWMSLTINKSVIVPAYPLTDFLAIPQTQRLTTTAANQSNQFDPSFVSLLEPNWNFIGTKDNVLKIELPSQMSAVDANTYVTILIRGTLAQNVTTFS